MDAFDEFDRDSRAAPGHRLGQMIGNFLEGVFNEPLDDLADEFGLYHDYNGKPRSARGRKLIWKDQFSNLYDMDHVLERGGSESVIGDPVGFIEVFWRRYGKQSRNKGKEDPGKMVPLLSLYPTTRFLGVISAGIFTKPAIAEVESKGIRFLHIARPRVFDMFRKYGAEIDYPERASWATKSALIKHAELVLTPTVTEAICSELLRSLEEPLQEFIERLRRDINRRVTRISLTKRSQATVAVGSADEAVALVQRDGVTGGSIESYIARVDFDNLTTASAELASRDRLVAYLRTLATPI